MSIARKLLEKNFSNFKVFSIEPTDYAYKKQIKNINFNPELKKKIFLFKYFISNKKKKPKKIYSSWSLENSIKSHNIHKGKLKKINKLTKNISLDEFVIKNNIKDKVIIKIDVDGFEMEVLKSSIKTLRNKKPVIFMEYAPYSFKEYGSNVKEFYNFLKKNGYQIFDLNFQKLDDINVAEGSSIDIVLINNKVKLF